MKPDRRFASLVEAAQRQGWSVRSGSRHLKLTSPDGKVTMPVPCSSGDRRAVLNFRAQLRRAGVNV